MSLPSLSISSFKHLQMIKIFIWFLAAAALIDITINYAFDQPKNLKKPSKLEQYFNYGRSIESKIFYRVSHADKSAANIVKAGWFETVESSSIKKISSNTKQRVFIYGMSFSENVGAIISELDRQLDVKMFSGPGAPLNHSYAYYQRHRPNKQGDVVILAVLASALPMINTITHMTSNFESPGAHFYPRYYLNRSDELVKTELAIDSLAGLRTAMHNKEQWQKIKRTLKDKDSFYDSIVFQQNLSDESVYLRLLKRAWGQKHKQEVIQRYHDNTGFRNTDRLVDISRTIITRFAEQVRNDGATPIVILFNNRGYDDHLSKILQPVLLENNIPYYSTHEEFPATQLSNFISDGHFTHAIDETIAKRVYKIITEVRK